MKNRFTAIILAAGQGKRMGSEVAKQFLMLQDKPVLYYSIKAFEDSDIDRIILVTSEDQVEYCRTNIVEYYGFQKVVDVICGGKERYDSVYNALIKTELADYVLIHDGARPFISKDMIKNIMEQVILDKACLIGTPVKETIKVVDCGGIIQATPNRNTLWAAQTPQAFEYTSIKKAYELFQQELNPESLGITDDAMVYEAYCKLPVKMIMGDYNNIKLTTPEDLMLAKGIVKQLLC
ncbi:MAG: ispD [Herbinix sp.]|jgi:2-C-methyl-D-erythritol 4-phosphate cytidylyltransferase|nr:ispD [Herbinix sp.]